MSDDKKSTTLHAIEEHGMTRIVGGQVELVHALANHDWSDPVKVGFTTDGTRLILVMVGADAYGMTVEESNQLAEVSERVLAKDGAGSEEADDVISSFLLALRDATRRAGEG